MKGIRDQLIEAAKERGGRESEIGRWRRLHPEEAKQFDLWVEDFVAVRQDGHHAAFATLHKIVEDNLSLRVTINTLTKWVRRSFPDEPSVQH